MKIYFNHHPVKLDSQQLPGYNNLFIKLQREETIKTHLSLWEINIILIVYFNIAKSLTKLKSCVSQTPNAIESFKSLLKECLTTGLPPNPLFSTPFR